MRISVTNRLKTVTRQITDEAEKDNRVRMCAAWLLDAFDSAESIHDSKLEQQISQLRQAMDAK